jgi:hypothetical protein
LIEDRLEDCHTEGAAQVTDLERRMTEEWTGLRSWVDAAVVAVVNRISSLECTLQSEMAERLSSAQLMSREFAEGAAHNEEQIKKIQGELDKLLFDMEVITVSQTFKRSMSKAGQIPPPAQTPPEEFTNSKVGVAGDTENSTENERQHTSTTPRKTTAATTTAPTMAPTNGGSIRSPTTLEGLSSTTTNASTSVSLGSLTKRMPSMQSPQVLNTGVSAPTTASQDGPMPSPRLLSHAQAPQLAPQIGPTLVAGQNFSGSISMAPGPAIDPLMRSTPRVAMPFLGSVPMTTGNPGNATSPLRAAFAYQPRAYEATSPFRSQMHVRRA